MIEPRVKRCPVCQSEKIVVTRLKGIASVVGVMDENSAIFAEVCTQCGQVVNLVAEHPENLKGGQ